MFPRGFRFHQTRIELIFYIFSLVTWIAAKSAKTGRIFSAIPYWCRMIQDFPACHVCPKNHPCIPWFSHEYPNIRYWYISYYWYPIKISRDYPCNPTIFPGSHGFDQFNHHRFQLGFRCRSSAASQTHRSMQRQKGFNLNFPKGRSKGEMKSPIVIIGKPIYLNRHGKL